MRTIAAAVSLLLVVSLPACRRERDARAGRAEVSVAAAANLTDVFGKLGPLFEESTGIHPVFSFASTALLTQQIENSAPFDVIAAADSAHIESLDRKGFLAPGSRAVYATGVLALWIPSPERVGVRSPEDLTLPAVRLVAIANPALAPYGQAAVETLRRLGIWGRIQPRVVYAENINIARQYGMSGNADAVFTAYSLVRRERGSVVAVDEGLHRPITQELGVIAKAAHPGPARCFADFLLSSRGRAILASFGYRVPKS